MTTSLKRLNMITGNKMTAPSNPISTTNSDVNIYNVPSNQIDMTNFLYDNQTILYVNSSTNPNLNTSRGKYIDLNSSATDWSFKQNNSQNYAFGSLTYNNQMQGFNQYKSIYNVDVTNGIQQTTNSKPLFVAIGANYTSSTQIESINTVPSYSSSGSTNYLIDSSYVFLPSNDVLIIKIIATIKNTNSMNVNSINSGFPNIQIDVTNQIVTNEEIANGVTNGKNIYKKTAFVNYGENFNATKTSYGMYNQIPLVFAPGCQNVWANISCLYIPPLLNNGYYYGQYLPSDGFVFDNGSISFNTDLLKNSEQSTTFGYFVFGFGYSLQNNNYSTYLVNGIQCDLLIKNIWRSPISIFNSYKNYSVSQMAILNVVLLFGNRANGGVFLALNTGTAISSISSYGITSLVNFINIMRAFIIEYDNNYQLVDFFTNEITINQLQSKGYDVSIVLPYALVDTNTIINPTTINTNPNLTYLLLHQPNNVNIGIDVAEQNVINQDIGYKPLNRDNVYYCSLGNLNYATSSLMLLKTNNNFIFADSINLGLETIDNKTYNINIILPESNFKPYYDQNATSMNIYQTDESAYYFLNLPYAERFNKQITITTTSPQRIISINRVSLIVSNNVLF